jgi:hypothetical protein
VIPRGPGSGPPEPRGRRLARRRLRVPARMRIGTSIGMIAVGLILALAVPFDLGTINLQLVGWILAVVGLLGLIASVTISRRAVVSRREVYPPDERF